MRIWGDFFFFWIKFIFYFFLFYIYICIFLDIWYTTFDILAEEEDDDFDEIITEYGIDTNINSIFDANYSEREEDYELHMCRWIDNFNHNYVFPTYNYFYPCKDPGYSLFFDSKFGIIIALLEFAVEDIGTDMLYVGSLVFYFFVDLFS